MRKYTIVLEQAPNNWAGYVADLPIVMATGATEAEVTERLRDAILFHLEGLQEHGKPIPEPPQVEAVHSSLTPEMTTRTIEVPV